MRLRRIKPSHWWKRAEFRLLDSITVMGIGIPARFVTDGFTLPPVLRAKYDPLGVGFEAAVLHDYLLSIGMDRKEAAEYFYKAMIKEGVPKVIAKIFYGGVRFWDKVVRS